jgi:hypothetical protein
MVTSRGTLRWARVVLGIVLVLLVALPMYRLLDPAETGLAGEYTLFISDIHTAFVWNGFLLLVPVALAGGLFARHRARHALLAVSHLLARPGLSLFAGAAAGVAVCAGITFALLVLDGRPNHVDSLAQLLHARFWADGRLAGPDSTNGEFWLIQNSLFTERGWVSQYPPGHIAVLTLFLVLGVPWLAGPLLMSATVLFICLSVHRLVPDVRAARLLSVLPVISPFFIALGASYMNHITAAAFCAVAAYALIRAWQDQRLGWAVLAGAAFGYALLTRPFSTAAVGAALALAIPFSMPRRPSATAFVRNIGLLVAGSLPFVTLLFAYNSYFFGHPLLFGYNVALGPEMTLGFHRDPWGNLYGVREAVGLTSADLLALSVTLMEAPLAAVAVIGVFLAVTPRLSAAERVFSAWALAPVAANFLYWHHGLFMGPRMLHEVAAPWAVLFGLAVWRIARLLPCTLGAAPRWNPRAAFVTATVTAVLLGAVWLAPQRLATYGGAHVEVSRVPPVSVARPALVFVHDAWTARIMATLSSRGYRLDTIETLMRQNSTCQLQSLADAALAGDNQRTALLLAGLDTVPRAARLPPVTEIAPGNKIRVSPGETLTEACLEQIRSDTAGTIDLAPLLWLGDLPGSDPSGVLYVRDFGPEHNHRMLDRYADREPWFYMVPYSGTITPELYPYDVGIRKRWRGQFDAGGAQMNAGNSDG